MAQTVATWAFCARCGKSQATASRHGRHCSAAAKDYFNTGSAAFGRAACRLRLTAIQPTGRWPTLTPRPATAEDKALIRSALLDAGGLKSFQKTIAMTDTLYGFDESSLAEQAAEVYVKAPGEFYVKAHRKGKPLEVLGTNRLLYTRDEAGNWVLNEEEKLRSDAELWINTSFDGPIQMLAEGQTATDTQVEEVINGMRARLYTWEKKNETGWFTGSTSKDSALIDLATGRLHRLVGCIVLDKDPTKVNCITQTISRHNEPVSIPDAPHASTSQAHFEATMIMAQCATGAIRTLVGEELNRLNLVFGGKYLSSLTSAFCTGDPPEQQPQYAGGHRR